ncbi:hypothetical protein ACFQJ7_01980 [Halovenus rubra]|uniref:Uncharacterized protein n=2 Tax=Halovenus rubra TaxID=869890 RepID=A0ACC7E398_9EURY|nr:hypothetical protein [Halovenus rubra]
MGHRQKLLEYVVAQYDREERLVTPAEAARSLGLDESLVAECLTAFTDCHLVVPENDGYRPTVTARELLALDCDGAIVDPCPEADKL